MESWLTIYIWNNWLGIALLACLFFALDNLTECLLIGFRVFLNAIEGTIIVNLLCVTVVLAFPVEFYSVFQQQHFSLITLGVCGGLIYSLYNFFYLKSLSQINDASSIKTFLGLRVFMLPVLAALLLGESLLHNHYIGILVALLGVFNLMICSSRNNVASMTTQPYIHTATVLLSFSMIIQAELYNQIGFFSGFMLFICGRILAGLIFLLASDMHAFIQICRKHFFMLVCVRLLGMGALILSQRAISLSPSVSFIAIIESLVPLYIMGIAAALIPFCRLSKHRVKYCKILKAQLTLIPSKIIAAGFVIFGITIITNESSFYVALTG